MGRKSMANQLIDEFRNEPEGPGLYVLAYDFILVSSERATRIIAKLVKHYGGEAAAFKIEKELDL